VAVPFLSSEWAEALSSTLNADEAFRQAIVGQRATIQQVISRDDTETHYWIKIADGVIDMGVGDTEGADATISQSYETAVKLATGELSAVTAFMTGKIKIGGNMGLLLGLQGAFSQLPAAMASIDVQY
jgi:putative sterol carrier protein